MIFKRFSSMSSDNLVTIYKTYTRLILVMYSQDFNPSNLERIRKYFTICVIRKYNSELG